MATYLFIFPISLNQNLPFHHHKVPQTSFSAPKQESNPKSVTTDRHLGQTLCWRSCSGWERLCVSVCSLNCYLFTLHRCLTISTRRWFWTSSDILVCWRRSRFGAAAFLSGGLSKISAPGLYQMLCPNTNMVHLYVTDIDGCVSTALLKLCRFT